MEKPLEIRSASWAEDGPALAAIRREVFIDEQQVPEADEWDGLDAAASHWLAVVAGEPIGTLRLLDDGRIGRVAVRRPWRGTGVGAALMRAALDAAEKALFHEVYLHSQVVALDFYAGFGFVAVGPSYAEAGIPHRTMRRVLTPRQLGLHGGRFAVHDRAAVALDLAQQCRRQLRILSNALEPALFDSEPFAEAVSVLARQHRQSEIRLLVLDGRQLAQRGHRLLELHRRLPTAVQIRRLELPASEVRDNFLIADHDGVFSYEVNEPGRAWADYHNRPVADAECSQFDDWWYRSSPDPNLRVLAL